MQQSVQVQGIGVVRYWNRLGGLLCEVVEVLLGAALPTIHVADTEVGHDEAHPLLGLSGARRPGAGGVDGCQLSCEPIRYRFRAVCLEQVAQDGVDLTAVEELHRRGGLPDRPLL